MTFIKNNREMVVVAAVITGLFIMACAIGVNFRGGQPWAF
jgi:hypothetical protein